MKVTGFLRGQRLSISSAVHIPGWGDFQITRIEVPPDPYALEKKQNHSKDIEMEETRVIHEVDPNQIVRFLMNYSKVFLSVNTFHTYCLDCFTNCNSHY